ncbi:MAG: DUF3822 family protein, partial [Bacteroidota bacterium]
MIYQAFQSYIHVPLSISGSMLPLCDLSIYLQARKLYYLLQSPVGEIVSCKEYRLLDQRMGQNMFLRLVFEREPILQQAFASCEVFLAEPPFTLLPQKYRSETENLLLARVILDDWAFAEDIVLRNVSDQQSVSVLFLQTQNLHDTLHAYLPYFTLTHVAQAGVGLAERLSQEHQDHISIILQAEQLILLAMKKGRLQLCNYYAWQAPLDIVYFVEAVREVCGLKSPDVPVFVCGELEVDTDISKAIWRYIPGLRFPTSLRSTRYDNHHYWKYAFLTQVSVPLP